LIEREDDKAETARRRISVYLEQTLPVLEHYRQQGVVSEVSGEGDIQDVRRRVLEAIGRTGQGRA
jgi:adenylate kinase